MAARREEWLLSPGEVFVVHVPTPGDDGEKVRILAEGLGVEVFVFAAAEGAQAEVLDGSELRLRAWLRAAE